MYLIKILKNISNYNLDNKNKYVVNFNMLRKCDEELINKILIYNSNENDLNNLDDDDEELINTSEEQSSIEEIPLINILNDKDEDYNSKFNRSKSI